MLDPFTPFGDCSLVRMANLYANVVQVGALNDIAACLDLVTTSPAQVMNLDGYGIAIGNPADLVALDCRSAAMAVAEIAPRKTSMSSSSAPSPGPSAKNWKNPA